jgi:hypothetical protein
MMTQPQLEALVDVLALAVCAEVCLLMDEDGLRSLALVRRQWKSDQNRRQYIDGALELGRELVSSDEQMADFVAQRASVFVTASAQKEVCEVLARILAGTQREAQDHDFYSLFVQSLPLSKKSRDG